MNIDKIDENRFNITTQVVKEVHVDELIAEAQDLSNKVNTMNQRIAEINDTLNQAVGIGVVVDQTKLQSISDSIASNGLK